MGGIRCGRRVVCALRNRADLAIVRPAANPRRPSTGDVAVAISGLRLFATPAACGRELVGGAVPGLFRCDVDEGAHRVPLPLRAPAVSR
jgi:hypothetical protein